MKRIALVLAALLAVGVMSGCEPAMTITGRVPEGYCAVTLHPTGKVTPANATKRVVLQRKTGGAWKDVKGYGSPDAYYADEDLTHATLRSVAISQTTGSYRINYYVEVTGSSTWVMRVRSEGGGSTSPAFTWVPPTQAQEETCGPLAP